MIEKERKFLLKYIPKINGKPLEIKQAYLMLDGEKKQQLRVRITNDLNAELTYKQPANTVDKLELNFDIDIETANHLWETSPIKLMKKRFTEEFERFKVDIDFYPNGLIIAEVEYDDDFPELLPDYIGEEVTNITEYSNIYIAKNSK